MFPWNYIQWMRYSFLSLRFVVSRKTRIFAKYKNVWHIKPHFLLSVIKEYFFFFAQFLQTAQNLQSVWPVTYQFSSSVHLVLEYRSILLFLHCVQFLQFTKPENDNTNVVKIALCKYWAKCKNNISVTTERYSRSTHLSNLLFYNQKKI